MSRAARPSRPECVRPARRARALEARCKLPARMRWSARPTGIRRIPATETIRCISTCSRLAALGKALAKRDPIGCHRQVIVGPFALARHQVLKVHAEDVPRRALVVLGSEAL